MKKTLIYSFLLASLLLVGCHKNLADTTPLEAPQQVLMPRNAYNMDLGTGQPVIFEWDYSMGGNVRYQIVFDRENGNFSAPIYSVLSDNSGVSPKATVSAAILKSVAKTAGAQAGETVTVRWTVRTFKGMDSVTGVKDGQVRTLVLTLPVEIDVLPATVQLSGSAVEGSVRDMEHELSVSKDASVVIEKRSSVAFASYLQMSDGQLTLIDNYGRKFYLTDDGKVGILGVSETAKNTPVTGLVCLSVDFEKLSWKAVPVKNIWFWNHPWNVADTYQSRMAYQGNGVWTVTVDPFKIALNGGGYDSRYHFRIDYNGADTDRIGPRKRDVSTSEIGTQGYTDCFRFSDGFNQWDYSWKTPETADWDNHSVTVTLTMRGETYTHSITLNN